MTGVLASVCPPPTTTKVTEPSVTSTASSTPTSAMNRVHAPPSQIVNELAACEPMPLANVLPAIVNVAGGLSPP
jgi:hypothetical protein